MAPETALTIEQAAERLQMNAEVLRRWIREGRVPAARLGRHYRLTEATVDRILRGEIDTSKPPQKRKARKRRKTSARNTAR